LSKTLIIAEAGVNHNGSEELAFQLVDVAIAAGANIVKFQTFVTKKLVTKNAEQALYQIKNIGKEESQYQMLNKLELSFSSHKAVKNYCVEQGIEYLSTAFDSESLAFLVDDLQLKCLKIASGELTNTPFVLEHALTGCDIILSTGMADLTEIEFALSVIAFGYLNKCLGITPSTNAFKSAYASEAGQKILKEKVTVLHCTTEYPAPLNEVNLNAMELMHEEFQLPIGYSDHTSGILVAMAAVAKGATVIEKHFTLDKSMAGPDHKASIDPQELAQLVQDIRSVELSLGQHLKTPTSSELKNKAVARKSIIANAPIKKGQVLSAENLIILRPGTGISPTKYYDVLGSKAVRDFDEGELLVLTDDVP
jgi:N-acetylneuraminate synthase